MPVILTVKHVGFTGFCISAINAAATIPLNMIGMLIRTELVFKQTTFVRQSYCHALPLSLKAQLAECRALVIKLSLK